MTDDNDTTSDQDTQRQDTQRHDTERHDDVISVAPRPSRAPVILVVIATALAVIASVTTWVRTEMLDTDAWANVSKELLADPAVQDALAVYLSNELYESVDVQASIADRLPDELSGLAGPLAGALREPITKGFDTLLASQRVQELWVVANRRAHEVFVAIVRDETRPGVSTTDGTVTLELGTMVRSVGESVGVPESALDRIPPDAGQVVVFESDQLAEIQTSVRILDFLSWFLFVVVVGLYALAVFLARDRRTHIVQLIGVGLAVGGLTVLLIQSIGVRVGVDFAVRNPSNEIAAAAVAQIATEFLRSLAWTGIVFGLVIVVVTFMFGDHRAAVASRRRLGPVTESIGALLFAVVGFMLVLVLLWWSPGDSFGRWPSTLMLIVVVIAAAVLLHRRVADETRLQQVADVTAVEE